MLRLLALALLLGACSGMSPKTGAERVARLLCAAQAGSDQAWRAFLSGHKHREDLPAPASLRRLLLGRRVLRLELGLAYAREDSKEMVSWWLGEAGFAGTPQELRAYLKETLAGQGFQVQESSSGLVFAASHEGITERVEVSGPHPWTGGRETACSVRVLWSVEHAGRPAAMTLRELLQRLPALRDERVDPSLVEALSLLAIGSAALGGTWTRYYSWEATSVPAPGESGSALRAKLRAALEAAGFALEGRESGYERFARAQTGSYALLYDPDPTGRVRLSVQPES